MSKRLVFGYAALSAVLVATSVNGQGLFEGMFDKAKKVPSKNGVID